MAALALLAACGGTSPADQEGGATSSAAVMVHGAAPVADCEADGGCNRPRIIDGLAEQYRAGAAAAAEQPAAPQTIQLEPPQPAQPSPAAEQQPAALPGQAVTEAGNAAAVLAQ